MIFKYSIKIWLETFVVLQPVLAQIPKYLFIAETTVHNKLATILLINYLFSFTYNNKKFLS